ncbi:hypothetical protein [Cytobacillus dafuensis]|uniref:Molecular chaperone GrpE n=1 Tax=Cytobacillus dafuensis TaxID=1742359 RepID=A0A5B8Z8Y6_CYTDA|nr:hypothetical protein [Cytobacillus dafuensis]QED49424.1 molecular chaperone GrpE [Cytobacillus dafuensis]
MEYIYSKTAKLIGFIENDVMWLQNKEEDWIHDEYRESYIHYGTIYANKKFHPLAISITGYFQDHDSKKWIKVSNGIVKKKEGEEIYEWADHLEDFFHLRLKTGKYKKFKSIPKY